MKVRVQSVSLYELSLGFPVCLVNYENLPFLYFDSDIEKTLDTLEVIHKQIFLAKFQENLTLSRGGDLILGETQKLDKSPR